jgi:hypothetical protein
MVSAESRGDAGHAETGTEGLVCGTHTGVTKQRRGARARMWTHRRSRPSVTQG